MVSNAQTTIVSHGGGTAVFIISTPDYTYIAADTKGGDNFGDHKTTFTECKIGKQKNIFFVSAGTFVNLKGREFNKPVNKIFNADEMIIKAIDKSHNFEEIIINIKQDIQASISALVPQIKAANQTMYQQLSGEILSSAITTYENKVKKFRYIRFIISNGAVNAIEDKSLEGVFFQPLGHSKEMKNYISSNENFLVPVTKEKLQFLIRLEIDKNPDWVGAPIDVIRIGNDNKHTWLTDSQHCF